jgi:hypothetical protein
MERHSDAVDSSLEDSVLVVDLAEEAPEVADSVDSVAVVSAEVVQVEVGN